MMFDDVLPALMLSLKVATCATLINVILGTLTGYALAKWRFVGRDLLDTILMLPMVLPPTVVGYYLIVLLGQNGSLGQWLANTFNINLIFTWQGAVVAASCVTFPLVVKPARSAFENVNPQLEQAARTLGVGEWGLFLRVTLPLAWHFGGGVVGVCALLGRIWRNLDDCRQHSP